MQIFLRATKQAFTEIKIHYFYLALLPMESAILLALYLVLQESQVMKQFYVFAHRANLSFPRTNRRRFSLQKLTVFSKVLSRFRIDKIFMIHVCAKPLCLETLTSGINEWEVSFKQRFVTQDILGRISLCLLRKCRHLSKYSKMKHLRVCTSRCFEKF